ncbi:hypothetical protein DYB37_006948 [Aphanomyces astaci]|uniref:DAGKc domain-containing protein n=1 Tax=Aphanomyces astaci TaxID=112090 RepID=A0A418F621_APHAT|nr:hypothetical protein DYB37_006948 [Aphanomyces astaci]
MTARRHSAEHPLLDHELEGAHDMLHTSSSMGDIRGVHFDGGLATPESDDMTQPTAVYRSMFTKRSQSFGTPSSAPRESSSFGYDDITMGIGIGTPPSSTRSMRDGSRASVQDIAKDMVINRKMIDEGVGLAHPEDVRDSIRMIQAYSRREMPLDCDLKASARIKKKPCTLMLSRDAFAWFHGSKRVGFIDTDDIVGAESISSSSSRSTSSSFSSSCFRLHYFRKGKGSKPSHALLRTHHQLDVDAPSEAVARTWIQSIQELVRWQARVPPTSQKRRIRVVINPHSGCRDAPRIWERDVKPLFDLAGFDSHVDQTTYGGHAVDMGREYSTAEGYEAIVFVSGDGTICEYMNGLLARPEAEWKQVVATTPISLISAGDIAAESEKFRWMGTKRYAFLKVKRLLFPKRHSGRLHPSRFRQDWWTSETGNYVAIGVLNSAPDGAFCHPSDGCLDLIVARKGNVFQMLNLAVLYLLGKERKSSLLSYVKVKAVVITQNEADGMMNMDGEVLPGPGPWRMEVVPSLFKVLSEK